MEEVRKLSSLSTLTDLGAFFAQSCYHPRGVIDITSAKIETYLKDCLNLPEVSHKVQFLLDNLGMNKSFKY